MSEYKPQDWEAIHDEYHDTWCVADNTDAVAYLWHLDEESHMRIALHEEHAEQHARLIAAAPALLEGCRLLLEGADCSDYGEFGIDNPRPVTHKPGATCPVCVARAAIAKAIGDTP